jgi:serine/threonine-protein kinase
LIDAGEIDGLDFMVMEYVQGESLDRKIRQERCLDPQTALEIAIGVCSAIAIAHSIQIIHRDLRPANILVTTDGIPKVSDFGTSKELKSKFLDTRIGSPPYMAPEHFKGRTVFQSDIWSLGITMYEMLTGTVPFYDNDPIKIAQAFLTREIVPPHLRTPKVPKAFSEVVMKCLKVDLGERFLSASQLLESLEGLSEGKEQAQPLTPQSNLAHPPIQASQAARSELEQKLCWNCYNPLPRLATVCPRCREKN